MGSKFIIPENTPMKNISSIGILKPIPFATTINVLYNNNSKNSSLLKFYKLILD